MKCNVLELFCGIGGMHWALKVSSLESGIDYEVRCAVDINTVTNSIYHHNYPEQYLCQREIQSLTTAELDKMMVNTVLMSPPCQPFTRVGLKKDTKDARTSAFFSLLEKFERLQNPLAYIFVENVKGFEESSTREHFVSFLKNNSYTYQEFLLTPLQFSIPNSRLRYYCIAKHKSCGDLPFSTTSQVMLEVPKECHSLLLHKHKYLELENLPPTLHTANNEANRTMEDDIKLTEQLDSVERIASLSQFLLNDDDNVSDYVISEKVMRYYEGLDIRRSDSRNSSCFTKRYGHYYVGSGSFLFTGRKLDDGRQELRYFAPREVARIMSFPDEFSFPSSTSVKQQYRALGNSLNVYVVANLIRIMTANSTV